MARPKPGVFANAGQRRTREQRLLTQEVEIEEAEAEEAEAALVKFDRDLRTLTTPITPVSFI
ncbi:MAG: hypothetical protein H7Y02_09155 [Candidatus Obscuribacterales bacterium]|nr:hypothetical protein [Steroidobacteraceae bacterium]